MSSSEALPKRWKVKVAASTVPLHTRVLRARGLRTAEQQHEFLAADFYTGHADGWMLPDMKVAVERLQLALEMNEAVAVFGDYDADGIPATALMVRALQAAGFTRVKGVIPTRKAGYGLAEDSLRSLVADGYTVAVTVDNGITAHAVAEMAKRSGLDLIITDHHEVVDSIPDAVAVIDPKRADSAYPNRSLCGTAVAYKLLWCLYEELVISHTYLKWQLDLVAVATIADMVPLTGENRVLAKTGLGVLRKTRNYGLRALMQVAGIDYTNATARDVMYGIAPRINALSRLGEDSGGLNDTNPLLTLLTTDDESRALAIAVQINELNVRRQTLVGEYAERAKQFTNESSIGGTVLFVPDVPSGLTGLIAGKIAQETGWPALILAREGDEIRGSGRSPTTLSLVELLKELGPLLRRYGGHTQAAGWSMSEDQIEPFIQQAQQRLQELAKSHPQGGEVLIDTVLQPHEVTLDNAQSLQQLQPFGAENAEPLFLWKDTITGITPMGKQKNHWRISTASAPVDIVYFGVPSVLDIPQKGATLYAAVTLDINTYSTPKPQLKVQHYYVG